MNILTVGKGFVANHLPYKQIHERMYPNEGNIQSILARYRPDVIVNCIGFCGKPNIDECEIEKIKTYTANTMVPMALAGVCEKLKIRMIQIGSGCVYYGMSPSEQNYIDAWQVPPEGTGWKETDVAAPLSFYSKTKYVTDEMIGSLPFVTTLRLRMPISSTPSPRNLIDKLKRYTEVIDEPNSVTYMSDLVRAVDFVISKKLTGIYHVASKEPVTATQVMRQYQLHRPKHSFKTISLSRLNQLTTAPRSNCLLDSSKIEEEGFVFEGSLEKTMKEYVGNENN